MRKIATYQAWHKLPNETIIKLFDETLEGITIQPSLHLVSALKAVGFCTLEVLENRTFSTVYRIKQTGVVYQVTEPEGETFEWDDYFDYTQDKPIDQLLAQYEAKPLKFTAEKDQDGHLWIKHHRPPRFKGKWVGGIKGIDEIEWTDTPTFEGLASLMRKAGAFVNAYFRNSNTNEDA
jgi:hypothetical protein